MQIHAFHRLDFFMIAPLLNMRIWERKRQTFSADKKMDRLYRIQKNTGRILCSLSFPFSTQYFTSTPTNLCRYITCRAGF